ncbi:MAG: hypothetical protein OIF54_14190, partial [Cohaesibacter sp.]|nr:hypothetical protein [Cohaesibacter sp.]
MTAAALAFRADFKYGEIENSLEKRLKSKNLPPLTEKEKSTIRERAREAYKKGLEGKPLHDPDNDQGSHPGPSKPREPSPTPNPDKPDPSKPKPGPDIPTPKPKPGPDMPTPKPKPGPDMPTPKPKPPMPPGKDKDDQNDPMKPPPRDPLVLDLDGDGVELIAVKDSTAYFDLNGDGIREKVA